MNLQWSVAITMRCNCFLFSDSSLYLPSFCGVKSFLFVCALTHQAFGDSDGIFQMSSSLSSMGAHDDCMVELNPSSGCPILPYDRHYLRASLLVTLPNNWPIELIPLIMEYYIPIRPHHMIAIDRYGWKTHEVGFIATYPHRSMITTPSCDTKSTQMVDMKEGSSNSRCNEEKQNDDRWHRLVSSASIPDTIGVVHINDRIYIIGSDEVARPYSVASCAVNDLLATSLSPSTPLSSFLFGRPHTAAHKWSTLHPALTLAHALVNVKGFRTLGWGHRLVLYTSILMDAPVSAYYLDTITNTWHTIAPTTKRYTNGWYSCDIRMIVYRDQLMYYSTTSQLRNASNEHPFHIYDEGTNTWNTFTDIKDPSASLTSLTMCIPIKRESVSGVTEELILIWDHEFKHIQSYGSHDVLHQMGSSVIPKSKWCVPKWLIGCIDDVIVIDNEWLVFVPHRVSLADRFAIVHIDDTRDQNAWRWYEKPPVSHYQMVIL
jgi:hypothetical protein